MLKLPHLPQLLLHQQHHHDAEPNRQLPSVSEVVLKITESPSVALHLLRQARATNDKATINLRTLVRVIMAATYNASSVEFESDSVLESELAAVTATAQQQAHHYQLLQRMRQEIETGGGRHVRRAPCEKFYRRAHDCWQVRDDRRACNFEFGLSEEDHLQRLRVASLRPPSDLPADSEEAVQAELDTFRRLHVCGTHRYNRWMMQLAIRIVLTHCRRLDSITLAWSDALIVPFIRDLVTGGGSSDSNDIAAFGNNSRTRGQLVLNHLQVKCFGLPFNRCIWNLTRTLAVRKLTVYTCLRHRVNVDYLLDLVRGPELQKLVIVSVERDRQQTNLIQESRPRQRFLEQFPRIETAGEQQQPVPQAVLATSDLQYLHAVGLYQVWPNFNPFHRLDDTLQLMPRLKLLYTHFFPDTVANPPDFDQLRWALDGCDTLDEAHTALRLIFDAYMLPKGDIGYWQRKGLCRFAYWEPVPQEAQFQSRAIAAVIVYPRLGLTFMVTCRKPEAPSGRFPRPYDINHQARLAAEAINRQARPGQRKKAVRHYPTLYTPLHPNGKPFDLDRAMTAGLPMGRVVRDLMRQSATNQDPVSAAKPRADRATGSGRAACKRKSDNDDNECPICMESLRKRFKPEQSTAENYKWFCNCGECPLPLQLTCMHKGSFHTLCLGMWFKDQNTCPVCRGVAQATRAFQARKP